MLSWNATGNGWTVPISNTSVRVTMPGDVTQDDVLRRSGLLPAGVRLRDQLGSHGHVLPGLAQAGEGLTVVVGAPLSSISTGAAAPILDEKFSVTRAFSLTPATLAGAFAILLLGSLGVGALVWGRGRDRRWPGRDARSRPAAWHRGGRDQAALHLTRGRGGVPTSARSPRRARSGCCSTSEPTPSTCRPRSSTSPSVATCTSRSCRASTGSRPRDWKLTRLKQGDDALLTYESMLLRDLFATGDEVLLSSLKQTFASELAAVRKAIETDAVKRGSSVSRPETTRAIWGVLGFVAVAAGIGITWLLATFTHAGLLGLALIVVGALLLFSAGRMPARTAKGQRGLRADPGFPALHLHGRGEPAHVRGVGRRLQPLPAVRHGVRRDRALGQGAGGPRRRGGRGRRRRLARWAGTPDPVGWNLGSLGDSLGSFAESSGSTFAASALSSGGSAGFSGGGFGGGGGGSW